MDRRFPIEDQIEVFASALRGRVITPAHSQYDELRAVMLGNFDYRPAALIRSANAADVAAALNFAQATGLELAVRSGGHSTVGRSSCNGLVVDLRDLNRIDIDAAAATVWCGAGLTAGDVTAAVEKHGMIVGFGDSASVGIGGLTLGGGIGYLVRKHGLTIDSLLAAEIVTAAGDILTVDAQHHPDLFWAIRGGGGNFGVVTRFKYRLHPLPSMTCGPLVLPATADALAGFVAAAQRAPEELSTIALVMTAPPLPVLPVEVHGKLVIVGMMAYAGDAAAAQQALAPFRALAAPIADLVRPAPYSSLYMLDPPPEMRPMVAIRSRFVEGFGPEGAAQMIAALERCTASMKMAQVRVLGGAMSRVPGEATAFAHRDAKMMVAFLALYGGGPDVQAAQERWAADALAAMSPGNGGAYVNFLADEGTVGVSAAYPPSTWARLRTVKRRYDPENLFRLNQNIPPA